MEFDKEAFDRKLYEFTEKTTDLFSIQEALQAIDVAVDELSVSLCAHTLLFGHLAYVFDSHNEDPDLDLWISKHAFFVGKRFRIQPNDFELSNNMFVIGTRLWPFHNVECVPSDLRLEYNGNSVPLCEISVDVEDAFIYFDLGGENTAFQMMCADHEENNEVFLGLAEGIVNFITLTAFDFTEVYRDLDIKRGDRLELVVKDWNNGVFELFPEKPVKPSAKKVSRWMSALDSCLLQGIEIFDTSVSIEDLLGFAFALGEDDLFTNSQVSIDEFIAQWQSFHVVEYGLEPRLWPVDKDLPKEKEWMFGMLFPDSDFEAFFYEKKLPVTEGIMQMLIYEFLSGYRFAAPKETDVEKFIEHVQDMFFPPFIAISAEEREKLRVFLLVRYDTYKESYSPFTDKLQEEARHVLIPLYTAFLKIVFYIRKEKVLPRELNTQLGIQINQLVQKILVFVNFVALNQGLEYNTYFETLLLSAENFNELLDETMRHIVSDVNDNRKKKNHTKGRGGNDAKNARKDIVFDTISFD